SHPPWSPTRSFPAPPASPPPLRSSTWSPIQGETDPPPSPPPSRRLFETQPHSSPQSPHPPPPRPPAPGTDASPECFPASAQLDPPTPPVAQHGSVRQTNTPPHLPATSPPGTESI